MINKENHLPARKWEPGVRFDSVINPAVFSFFSGAGFLDLGFEVSGFNLVFANEIHKPFLEAHKFSRNNLRVPSPIFGYSNDDIRDFVNGNKKQTLTQHVAEARLEFGAVGFVGGPPCPDFSIGGKNKGADGKNGVLTRIYFELIAEQRPDFFVFENVKGLLRTARHRHFYTEMKEKAQNNDFVMTERLINAIEYGVPQDRDRIILVGFNKRFLSAIGKNYNAPFIGPDEFDWNKYTTYSRSILKDTNWPTTTPFIPDSVIKKPEGIQEELTVEHWFNKNRVEDHPNSDDCFVPRAGLTKFLSVAEGDDSKKSYKRLHRWRYSPTAAYGNNEVHLHPNRPRRITVAEALALQSLPKDFALPQNMSLSNMFKTVGNGVPFLASKAIAQTVGDFIWQI